jgi:phosphatidate cytidylyltransferase
MQKKKEAGFNMKRVIVAAVFLPVFISYIYYLPAFPFFLILLLIVGMLAMREFYVMYGVPASLNVPAVIIGGILFYYLCRYPEYFPEGVFVGLFLLLLLRLFVIKSPSGSMSEAGTLGIGLFYIAGFLSFQWFLRTENEGLKYIFLLYTSGWLADSAAYYVGSYLGRNKLYPSVSPNKTVEGALGSLMGGAVGSVVVRNVMEISGLSTVGAMAIGMAIGIATLLGDLIESMFKRDAGVKDSSGLIPGHGGILDKLDGFLISGPILYLIVRYM